MTQPNPSPSSFLQQNERNASRTWSPRGKSPSGRKFRLQCKENLKELAPIRSVKKWHPPECLFYMSENGCRFDEKCSCAHRQVDEQPSKRSKKNGDKSAVAMLKRNEQHQRTGRLVLDAYPSSTRLLRCVFQDMEPPKSSSILRKSSDMRKPIRRVKTPRSSCRTRSQSSSRRITKTATGLSWSSSARPYETEGIAKIPEFCLRWAHQTEVHRGSENYYGIIWKTSRTTEWSRLHEWFRDFRDAESICSGNSHVTSPPGVFPRHPPFEGMLRPSFISQRQTEEPPNIRDTSGISGNVFAHPQNSSSAPYPQELNSTWRKTIEEPIHMSTAEKSGRPERDPDLRCQSGPSAKDSVIFSGGDSSKNYGADQQRLQISDLHFDKFPTSATFACWKIRFNTEVCTCSQFPTEAMQWITEVELVDSVDELRSSSPTRGISMPNFEVLDARIPSALNKIIHNSHFKRKISLEEQKAQKEDRFLRGRQIAYLIYEQFRVTGTDDSVENYTDLFTIALRNNDIQEFDSKWDGILLSMTKIPHDDILESLYKLWIRESEKLKTVLELYNMEIHQKIGRPDHHRLKAMVKRSIEQNLRIKNFEARNGNFEKNAVVKNQGTKQRVQRILGDCWQWQTNGQCVKGNNCSFRHDMDKRGKSSPSNPSQNSFMQQSDRKPSRTRSPRGKSPSGRMSRWPCKDYFRGTCNNSFCKRWHPPECLFYKTKSGCRFGEKCSFAHRQVDEQPTKRSKKNNDKSAVAILKKGDWQERGSVTDQSHDR